MTDTTTLISRDDDPNAMLTCDVCAQQVKTEWGEHAIEYGSGDMTARLDVRLPVRRCDHCNFSYLDDEGERLKHEAVCRHLGVLTPREIRDIRTRLGLSRSALAALTGIGQASLSRWENGIKIQTPGYDRYLRLLNHASVAPLLKQLCHVRTTAQPRHATRREADASTSTS